MPAASTVRKLALITSGTCVCELLYLLIERRSSSTGLVVNGAVDTVKMSRRGRSLIKSVQFAFYLPDLEFNKSTHFSMDKNGNTAVVQCILSVQSDFILLPSFGRSCVLVRFTLFLSGISNTSKHI
jgi:hypothetical protein